MKLKTPLFAPRRRSVRPIRRLLPLALTLTACWVTFADPGTARADEVTSTPAHGMRETVIQGRVMWWRDSVDFAGNQWPRAWIAQTLAQVWGRDANHPRTSAIDAFAVRPIYDGVTGLQVRMRQIVFGGATVWQRDSTDAAGTNWPTSWTSFSLTTAWGGQVNAPPTDRIDAAVIQSLVDTNGQATGMRQIFYAGGFLYQRDSRDRGGLDWPTTWVKTSLSTAWGGQLNAPPTTQVDAVEIRPLFGAAGEIARFRQIVLAGTDMFWRESTDLRGLQWPTSWNRFPLSGMWGGETNHPPSRADATATFRYDIPDFEYGVKLWTGSGFAMAEGGGGGFNLGGAIAVNSLIPGDWETFVLHDLNGASFRNGDSVYLQAFNGTFVNAVGGGGTDVLAYNWFPIPFPYAWTTLRSFRRDGGQTDINEGDEIGLQTVSGLWLSSQACAGTGVHLEARATGMAPCSTFKVIEKVKRPRGRQPGRPEPPTPGNPCTFPSQCEAGLICSSFGLCARCLDSGQCAGGEVCNILPGQTDGLCVKTRRQGMSCEATVWCDELAAVCPFVNEFQAKSIIDPNPAALRRGAVHPSELCAANDTLGLHSNWYVANTNTFTGSTWECNCCERGTDRQIHLRYGAKP